MPAPTDALRAENPAWLRLGTRASPLALTQTEQAQRRLVDAGVSAEAISVIAMRTTGDRIKDRPLADVGGKGLFTKELDEALLDGRIDAAVHSAKDVPTWLPDGIVIAACLPRIDVRDAFVSSTAAALGALPRHAVVGTSSPRRKALILHTRPDLTVVDMRGNVQTRLRKLADREADATLLALAGLTRLGMADRAASLFAPEDWPPAVGQGTIAITARADDHRTRTLLSTIDHGDTHIALACERAYLDALGGSCHTPIGGHAKIIGDRVAFAGIILRPDGSSAHRVSRDAPVSDAEPLGRDAGTELAKRGGAGFFDLS